MNRSTIVNNGLTVLLSTIIVFVVLSQVFGFPSPIAFVATDSMEPAMNPGEGFVGIPAPLAGEISEGDVVTYRAQTIQDGGLTTHRIEDRRENGYITKGDANAVTDQANGEPIVTDAQIELVALQLDGQVVTIPGVGSAAQASSTLLSNVATVIGLGGTPSANVGLTIGLVGILVVGVGLAVDWIAGGNSRTPSRQTNRRETIDSRLILVVILLALSLPVTAVMAIPSGSEELTVLSTAFEPSGGPLQIEAGGRSQIQSTIENSQPFPIVVILQPQTDGIRYSQQMLRVPPGETAETQVTISAPEEVGSHVRVRSEHHYIHVLPATGIRALHDVHPFVAVASVNSVILIPVAVLFYLFFGFRQITIRDTAR